MENVTNTEEQTVNVHKELEETVIQLNNRIQRIINNGSSEELAVLPELVKSLADFHRSIYY